MSEIILYTTDDGLTKINVQLEDETVWLTQEQMATLFGKAKSTINEHIKNIYEENELFEAYTMKKFGISEFQQRAPRHLLGGSNKILPRPGRRDMNTPLALKLEQALGLEEGYFMILQAYYDIKKEKEKQSQETPDLTRIRAALF